MLARGPLAGRRGGYAQAVARSGGSRQSLDVNLAGLVQGIVLVTFPAASTIFTSSRYYGLSSTEYGIMFLPQVVTAVAASLLGAELARRITLKRVYLLGLTASLVAMVLLIASVFVQHDRSAAYPLLLVATAFLGTGFGLTVPALNSYASAFHPAAVNSAVLVLNALLGLGTFWPRCSWPSSWACASGGACRCCRRSCWQAWCWPVSGCRCRPGLRARRQRGRQPVPRRFWLYAGFILLYGICETMNGNWSQLEMTRQLGSSAAQASLALAAFWGVATAGRVAFAAADRWLAPRLSYRLLPVVLIGAFVLIGQLGRGDAAAGIAAFALAGLGCSALLPLTISFGEPELTAMSAAVTGGVIAAYQVGYGIAAFGVGRRPPPG